MHTRFYTRATGGLREGGRERQRLTAAADAAAGRDHEPERREEEAPKVLRVQGPEGVVPPVLVLLVLLPLLPRGAARLVLREDGVAQLCGSGWVGRRGTFDG